MTPEQWEEVGRVFDAAAALRSEERASFLDQACGENQSLRREVSALLEIEGRAGDFLDGAAMEDVAKILAKDEPPSLAGKMLGHYEVISLIGSGGMGEVYRAHDVSLKREVAVKVLPSSFSQNAERLRRFKQEARAASALNHPNIVTIHEIGEIDSCHFIVSEYIEGETLRQRLTRGRLKLTEALEVVIQISSALEAAHRVGIVHRDIKPENVMVRHDGLIKVLDFGLAKLTESQTVRVNESHAGGSVCETRSGMIMGTTRYMSPEQARGLGVDARSDIWSLGVVLYEMVADCAPFTGATDSDVVVSILEREPPSLIRQVPNLPPELQRIVGKALRKDREERFQVVKEMLLDLKSLRQELDFATKLAQTAQPESAPEEMRQNVSRQTVVEADQEVDPPTSSVQTERSRSNAESAVGEIKYHNTGRLHAFVTVLGAAARPFLRSRLRIAVVVAGIVLLAVGLTWRFRPSFAPPKVVGYTQLTNNGLPKFSLQTDGTRLYFWQSGGNMEVSVGGGEVVPLQPSFPVLDISLSRSERLIGICDRPPDPDMSLYSIPIVGGTPRKLAHTHSSSARWSPDGSLLAYSQTTSLQLANADGTNSRQLVALENEPFGLHWSPDGKKLRFSLNDLKSNKTDIWEISADGTNLHRWLPDWRPDLQKGDGCWIDDGKYFVFATSPGPGTPATGAQFALWATRETTDFFHRTSPDPVQLMTGPTAFHDLVASLDGKRLFAVSSSKGRGQLVRYDARSGEWVPTYSGMSSAFVSFSRDGNWMAYLSFPDGMLWRSKTDGSQRLQLTFAPLEVGLPRLSPDGTRISYSARAPDGNWKIYVISAEGGDSQCLTQGDDFAEAVWSPDGKSLALSLEGTGPNDQRSSIQILDLETRKTTLLPDSFGKFSPRWSPDGRFIAAIPWIDHRGLLLFDFQKQKWEELVEGMAVGYPSFSRDGKFIYFERSHASDVYRVKISDRSLVRIASVKESAITAIGIWLGLDPTDAPMMLKDISSGGEVFALEWQAP